MTDAKQLFTTLFGTQPTTIARAPGRAEILGCHTDYNSGYALAAGISESTFAYCSKKDESSITVASTAYPNEVITFSLNDIAGVETNKWTNYIRAVAKELVTAGHTIGGANILIDSTVPKSGGVSSSAALELAVAYGLLQLYKYPIDAMKIALLCKQAENSPIVKSPCGFLDQGSSAFAKKDALVLMDFLPKGNDPVSSVTVIPAEFPIPATFIIPVDPTLERQLGETGYVARRKMCEDSLPFWSTKLGRPVTSLRQVSVVEFEMFRKDLDLLNPVMRKRCEHIVYENARVLAAVVALKNKKIDVFGNLLTEGGKSSLELYGLDENTPQLTFLVEKGRVLPGVLGMRNMGGGFSAIALALVKNESLDTFKQTLSAMYAKQFDRTLDYIAFTPGNGAEIVYG